MKHSWRDYCTIIMAFAAVFLCGYGVGHLVGERRIRPEGPLPPTASWEGETLRTLTESLELRPDQARAVEEELSRTAHAIQESHDAVLLDYHQHVLRLYESLIKIVDEEQASRLRAEKNSLENQIQRLSRQRGVP